jgi:hypothetical protein
VIVDRHPPMTLEANDFVLVPAMRDLINTSLDAPSIEVTANPIKVAPGAFASAIEMNR